MIESIDSLEGKLRDFEVSESDTISDASVVAPTINADLFEPDSYDTVNSLILIIECCQPLLFSIQQLTGEKMVELSEDGTSSVLITALQDEDFGRRNWTIEKDLAVFPWFVDQIEVWLNDSAGVGAVDQLFSVVLAKRRIMRSRSAL